jgi:hypothetical protein
LEALSGHAKALHEALRTQTVLEALVEATVGRHDANECRETAATFKEIGRLLATLPDDLCLLEKSARTTITRLELEGQSGSKKADYTYRPRAKVLFTRSAMDLWKVAKQTRAPSKNNDKFKRFANDLWLAGVSDSGGQDWSRAIEAARRRDRTNADAIMRWEAHRVVKPLINAVRLKKAG